MTVDIDVEEFSNQALEDELLAISPTELAKIAIEQGNAAKGKQLFLNPANTCFACHNPPQGTVRLGPDLETIATKLTNEQLVDAVLRPSDLIEKSFAQLKVLTVEGTIHTGVLISEDDDKIVLRNLAQPTPIKIPQDDVEDVVESKTSLMPANLARLLRDRGEFNDLMKYIIETRKRQ
jgi:putative heme-binding domain-containing protein